MSGIFQPSFFVALLTAGVRMSVPLIYGSLGDVVSEKTGVINIGLEGQMLAGAFFSYLVTVRTGSMLLGIACGGLAGMCGAAAVAFWTVYRRQDQSIVGIMFNLFAVGFTNFLNRVIFGAASSSVKVGTLRTVELPVLSGLPLVGQALFNQNALTYFAFLCAAAIWIMLNKTKFGLQITATGENPRVCQAAGVDVRRMRSFGYLFCGFMAGIGGAFLPLGIVGNFTEEISSGRGFICLAIVILARWNPFYVLLASIGFGAVQALQMRLQALGSELPYQFFVALPYLITILTLIFLGRNIHSPRDLGNPYRKESR